jgi:hypothetical protein
MCCGDQRVAHPVGLTKREPEDRTDRARSRTHHGSQQREYHQAGVASSGIDGRLRFWRHRSALSDKLAAVQLNR